MKGERKMTKRDFLKTVIATSTNTEVVDFARDELVKMEAKLEKARATKSVEHEAVAKAIHEYMASHTTALGSDIAKGCGISTSKAIAIANKMVEDGTLTVAKVKIPKVGVRNLYSL